MKEIRHVLSWQEMIEDLERRVDFLLDRIRVLARCGQHLDATKFARDTLQEYKDTFRKIVR